MHTQKNRACRVGMITLTSILVCIAELLLFSPNTRYVRLESVRQIASRPPLFTTRASSEVSDDEDSSLLFMQHRARPRFQYKPHPPRGSLSVIASYVRMYSIYVGVYKLRLRDQN